MCDDVRIFAAGLISAEGVSVSGSVGVSLGLAAGAGGGLFATYHDGVFDLRGSLSIERLAGVSVSDALSADLRGDVIPTVNQIGAALTDFGKEVQNGVLSGLNGAGSELRNVGDQLPNFFHSL
jgi:hypothetical protein